MARMCRGGERTEGRIGFGWVGSSLACVGLGWVGLTWLGSAWLGLAWLAITSTIDLITLCDSLAPVVSSFLPFFFFFFVLSPPLTRFTCLFKLVWRDFPSDFALLISRSLLSSTVKHEEHEMIRIFRTFYRHDLTTAILILHFSFFVERSKAEVSKTRQHPSSCYTSILRPLYFTVSSDVCH